MYALALLFLAAAAVTLGLGFLGGGTALILASVGCSAASVALVAGAVLGSAARPRRPSGPAGGEPAGRG